MAYIDHTTADGVVVQHGDTVWDEFGNPLTIRSSKIVVGEDCPWDSWYACGERSDSSCPVRFTHSTLRKALMASYERLERRIIESTTLQAAVSRRLVELDEQES